jgi:arylsulfatase A-like enzyme
MARPDKRVKVGSRRTIAGLLLVLVASPLFTACRGDSPPAGPRPNIVLIIVDALRKDHLSAFGYPRPTSPRLDALVAEGALFENMTSAASQTVPATASLLTGLYPSQSGVQYFGRLHSFDGEHHWQEAGPHLAESHTLMAEWLGELGYRTGAAVSNPWLQSRFGFSQGFEDYFFDDCVNLSAPKQDVCDGNDLVERALEWLTAASGDPDTKSPFFLYLHFMDVHSPYAKPGITTESFVERRGRDRYVNGLATDLSKRDLEYMTALYDEGIHHLDGVIGRFWDQLLELGAAENTLFLVTSDHGDEFHEHGGLGHGTTLYEELLASFLLLRYPERLPAGRIAAPISMIDLMPTLAELLEEPLPIEGLGRSVLGLATNPDASGASSRPLFSELGELKAIRRGDWKLILNVESGGLELFNVVADPGEQENLADSEPENAQRLRDDLLRFLAGVAAVGTDSPHVPLDEETLERLRALGYVQ